MDEPTPRPLPRWALPALVVFALVWRVVLTRLYWGSEEEDYGNLGLIIGTLQSGFRYVETEHMPLFTTLAAAVTAATGDAETGGEIVAVLAGASTVGVVGWIGARWLGPAVGLLAGLLLALQPDAALTSATPLRIPLYTALLWSGIALVGARRAVAAGFVLALAFLTRFDAAFTLLPASAIAAGWSTAGERRWRAWWTPALLLLTALGWAAWYHHDLGTWRFWGDVAGRQGRDPSLARTAAFVGKVVPWHAGWPVALLAPMGLLAWARGTAREPLRARWLLLAGCSIFGFLLLAVFLSAYRYDHNLFWKWSAASMPLLLLAGAHGLLLVGGRLSRRGRRLLFLAFALAMAASWSTEYRSQLRRSDTWYGTQVRLARWWDRAAPEGALVAELIPATWLSRLPRARTVHRWSGGVIPQGGGPEVLGRWLLDQDVTMLVWFAEDWVPCHGWDPWLQPGAPVSMGPARLLPVAREDEYGFIAYEVSVDLERLVPRALPPLGAGGVTYQVQTTR